MASRKRSNSSIFLCDDDRGWSYYYPAKLEVAVGLYSHKGVLDHQVVFYALCSLVEQAPQRLARGKHVQFRWQRQVASPGNCCVGASVVCVYAVDTVANVQMTR